MLNSTLITNGNQQQDFNLSKLNIKDSFLVWANGLPEKKREIIKYLLTQFYKYKYVFVSHKTIADNVGCSREYVLRVLKEIEQLGIISSFGSKFHSKNYILHDFFRTKEVRERLDSIFKAAYVSVALVVSVPQNVENFNPLETAVQQQEVTPIKEIRNMEISKVVETFTVDSDSTVSPTTSLNKREVRDSHNRELKCTLQGNCDLPETEVAVTDRSNLQCCDIICETVDLRNFKEQRTSIMQVNITPALRKATDAFKLTYEEQVKLTAFSDDTLEIVMKQFDARRGFNAFKEACWSYIKSNRIKPKQEFFDLSKQLPKVQVQSPTVKNKIPVQITKPNISTAIEVANGIHLMKVNKEEAISNLAKLMGREHSEAFYFKVLTGQCNKSYITTGDKNEELAIKYIEEHRALYPAPVIPDSKERESYKSNYKYDVSFLDEFGVKEEKTADFEISVNEEEDSGIFIEQMNPVAEQLLSVFGGDIIEHSEEV